MRIAVKISLIASSLTLAVITGAPAMALGQGAANSRIPERVQAQATQTGTSTAAERRAEAQTRLAEAKLKACQNREKAINNIMSRITTRGQKQVDLFSTIADRTETFYTTKGKTLSNYGTLVADVNAKKADAQSAVDTVKANSVSFKCDGTDPKGAATSFKDSLKTEISALKAYKTSVKNLIVGVKSVQGATSSTENQTTGGAQ